jgi:hypothetical protein
LRKKHSKAAMQTRTAAHPGVEMDAKGHPIAMAKRLPEDREKVRRKTKAVKRKVK